eukprot:281799-Amphidinium_carterae.1
MTLCLLSCAQGCCRAAVAAGILDGRWIVSGSELASMLSTHYLSRHSPSPDWHCILKLLYWQLHIESNFDFAFHSFIGIGCKKLLAM